MTPVWVCIADETALHKHLNDNPQAGAGRAESKEHSDK
jgi:hypothetical protein